ncbi:hypothetical protein [Lutimonas vermicola]|uniref:Uncharacterized protein n=1 Tax=Lutimonas vermicola TaxID=414288 RepID=A0ABU9L429_9FLAO
MKKLFSLILMLFIVAFYSCNESGNSDELEAAQADSNAYKGGPNQQDHVYDFTDVMQGENVKDEGCYTETKELYGGQSIDVGGLTYSSDNENIYITYTTEGDWYLEETHLFVGCPKDVPFNNAGNPVIGAFPLKAEHDPMVQSYTYMIPRSNFDNLTCSNAPCEGGLAVITHASVNKLNSSNEVIQQETAFQQCTPDTVDFPGNRWGCWDWFCPQDCELTEAWLYKEGYPSRIKCFERTESDGDKDFGFSNKFQYPYGGTYPVYTNVGEDCDVSSKIKVGTLRQIFVNKGEPANKWVRFIFTSEGDYLNANGVMSIWIGWPDPVDNGIFVGDNSGLFLTDVVDGESVFDIEVDSWPGTPGDGGFTTGNPQYFVVSKFTLEN